MRILSAKNYAEGFKKWLSEIYYNYEYETSPRGKYIREITNLTIVIENPLSNMYKNEIRSLPKKYLAGELIWYFSGRNDVDFISKYSKFWNNIVNPDGKTVNSAYGYLLFTEQPNQWHWAKSSLINDKDSRQAIMHFNKPHHQFYNNKDFVCTMYMKFDIRNNKLNAFVSMRSSDAIRGITYDWTFFMLLQEHMLFELRNEKYPDLEIGTFTFLANSAHIYEEHFQLVENMLRYDFIEDSTPRIRENLILNPHLFNIKSYNGPDEFLLWLKENS